MPRPRRARGAGGGGGLSLSLFAAAAAPLLLPRGGGGGGGGGGGSGGASPAIGLAAAEATAVGATVVGTALARMEDDAEAAQSVGRRTLLEEEGSDGEGDSSDDEDDSSDDESDDEGEGDEGEGELSGEQPTEEPTAEPTEEPTAEPTDEPTAEPTEEPTAEPTAEPTEEPTAEPTAEPTEEPTAEPVEPPEEPDDDLEPSKDEDEDSEKAEKEEPEIAMAVVEEIECYVDSDCLDGPALSWCRPLEDGSGGCVEGEVAKVGGKCATYKVNVDKPCSLPGTKSCAVTLCGAGLVCEDGGGKYGTCQEPKPSSSTAGTKDYYDYEGGGYQFHAPWYYAPGADFVGLDKPGCTWDTDCADGEWCRTAKLEGSKKKDECDKQPFLSEFGGECVPTVGEGSKCGGGGHEGDKDYSPCTVDVCDAGLLCVGQADVIIEGGEGTCVPPLPVENACSDELTCDGGMWCRNYLLYDADGCDYRDLRAGGECHVYVEPGLQCDNPDMDEKLCPRERCDEAAGYVCVPDDGDPSAPFGTCQIPGEPIVDALEGADALGGCAATSDCPEAHWCRQTKLEPGVCNDKKKALGECVPYAEEGELCEEADDLQCYRELCDPASHKCAVVPADSSTSVSAKDATELQGICVPLGSELDISADGLVGSDGELWTDPDDSSSASGEGDDSSGQSGESGPGSTGAGSTDAGADQGAAAQYPYPAPAPAPGPGPDSGLASPASTGEGDGASPAEIEFGTATGVVVTRPPGEAALEDGTGFIFVG